MLPSAQWSQYRESAALNEVTGYDSLRRSLCLSASRSWPPRFRYSMGPTTASRGGQGAEGGGSRQGREVRWLIWARNCPTKSNFISPEACLDNRATKWPAANLTISSTNFAGDYFTRCSLVRPWGRTQRRRRRRRVVGIFLAFLPLGPRHHARAGHEKSVSWKRPPTRSRQTINPLGACVNDRIVWWYGITFECHTQKCYSLFIYKYRWKMLLFPFYIPVDINRYHRYPIQQSKTSIEAKAFST